MALKVIGAGLGRTATLSLKFALEHLGFGPCYHMAEVFAGGRRNVPLWLDVVHPSVRCGESTERKTRFPYTPMSPCGLTHWKYAISSGFFRFEMSTMRNPSSISRKRSGPMAIISDRPIAES